MPVIPFPLLCPRGPLKDAAGRIVNLDSGLVLSTGQAGSGKLTILLGIADLISTTHGREVVLFTDQPDHYLPFRPLPEAWTEVAVTPTNAAWQAALATHASSNALLVVAPLGRENVREVMAVATDRLVFAALETVLDSLDVSYAMREMSVEYEQFANTVRCIWSQFLLPALCDHCGRPASFSGEERDLLRPTARESKAIKEEVGCPACDGLGTSGRVALSDVTFIPQAAQAVVKTALVNGVNIELGADLRITARDQARVLLVNGVIGLRTYRSAMQRNPLLRAQNALSAARIQAAKLSRMFDTFVASLWLDLDVLASVAERTTAGLIVSEGNGRVRYSSARARRALLGPGDLSINEGVISGSTPRVQRALDLALAEAVGPGRSATRLKVALQGASDSHVFVTPLPIARGFTGDLRGFALIVVGGTGFAASLPNVQDLREYFDLTPAESRIAVLLCEGRVVKQVALELRISMSTVRTHVRALLAKTGTRRQSQLIQLLTSLPVAETVPANS